MFYLKKYSYLLFLVFANNLFANASNIGQLEFINKPAGKDFVNSSTGDLNYSIDLGSIKTPGAFNLDMSLVYSAGIRYEQEASWVGLGWSFNIGSITRVTVGFPDDYRDDAVNNLIQTPPAYSGFVFQNGLANGFPLTFSNGAYSQAMRISAGVDFSKMFDRNATGFLYQAPADMLYKVDTYNPILRDIMNSSGSWQYSHPSFSDMTKCTRAPDYATNIRSLEYLKYNDFNMPAQDLFVVSAPGLNGSFKAFTYNSTKTFYSEDQSKDGSLGKISGTGSIAAADLWNKSSVKFSPDFKNGFVFKMINEGVLNAVDNPGMTYAGSDNIRNIHTDINGGAKNINGTRIIPLWDNRDKIGGFIIVKQDGTVFWFTKALYNHQKISYSTSTLPSKLSELPANYGANYSDGSIREELSAYATTWLLTAITGPDYLKKTYDNSWSQEEKLLPHEGDLGAWVAIRYEYSNLDDHGEKIDKAIQAWRDPYGDDESNIASAFRTAACSQGPKQYSTQFGLQEITYLHSVETPSDFIYFKTGIRADGKGVDYRTGSSTENKYPKTPSVSNWSEFESGKKFKRDSKFLQEIQFYSKSDCPDIKGMQSLKNITDFQKEPYRKIKLHYNYSLGKGSLNSAADGNGRLTLALLELNAQSEYFSPYIFDYQETGYLFNSGADKLDAWGFVNNTVTEESQKGLVWNLSKITTPEGAETEFYYERDRVKSAAGTMLEMVKNEPCYNNGSLRYDESNNHGYYDVYTVATNGFDDNKNITVNENIAENTKLGGICFLEFQGTYIDGTTQNIVTVTCNDYSYIITGINGKTITLDTRPPYGKYKVSGNQVFTKSGLKKIYVVKDNRTFWGEDIRVSKIVTNPKVGNTLTMKYNYPVEGTIGILPDKDFPPPVFTSETYQGQMQIPFYSGVSYYMDYLPSQHPFRAYLTDYKFYHYWEGAHNLPDEVSYYDIVSSYSYNGCTENQFSLNLIRNNDLHYDYSPRRSLSCVGDYRISDSVRIYSEKTGCEDFFYIRPGTPFNNSWNINLIAEHADYGDRLNLYPNPCNGCEAIVSRATEDGGPLEYDDRIPKIKNTKFIKRHLSRKCINSESFIEIPAFTKGRYDLDIEYWAENDCDLIIDGRSYSLPATTEHIGGHSLLHKATIDWYCQQDFDPDYKNILRNTQLSSFTMTATGNVYISRIKLTAVGGLNVDAQWRTMSNFPFQIYRRPDLATGLKRVYYPIVQIQNEDSDGNSISGVTEYINYTSQDLTNGKTLFTNTISDATQNDPRILSIVDKTGIIGNPKIENYYSNTDKINPISSTEYVYGFGEDIAKIGDEKYSGVLIDGTSEIDLGSEVKPLGVTRERLLRLEEKYVNGTNSYPVSAITDISICSPFLIKKKETIDGLTSQTEFKLFDARTGQPVLNKQTGSGLTKTSANLSAYMIENASIVDEIIEKNTFLLPGGSFVTAYDGAFSCIDDLYDHSDLITASNAFTYAFDQINTTNLPITQKRTFLAISQNWTGGPIFTWPQESSTNWLKRDETIGVDRFLRSRETMIVPNIKSTTIFRPRMNGAAGVVNGASFKECGVFTCDYDENESGYFDKENGWYKNNSNEINLTNVSTICNEAKHFGNMGLKVTNAYGPTRVFKLERNKDYELSAWVKPVVTGGSSPQTVPLLKNKIMGVSYFKSSDNGATWPLSISNTEPEIASTGEMTVVQYGDWYYCKLSVPSTTDINDEDWNDGYQYALAWVGTPFGNGNNQNATIYIDDIRFSPNDAFVNTTYYDNRLNLPIISIDSNNKPGNKLSYDDLGRPVLIEKLNLDLATNDPHYKIIVQKIEYSLQSDLYFGDKLIQLITPNENATYTEKENLKIQWMNRDEGVVSIYYEKADGSDLFQNEITNVHCYPGVHSFDWIIPKNAVGTKVIRVKIGEESDASDHSFIIKTLPNMPVAVSPINGAIGVPILNGQLKWKGGDLDGDVVTYDVYFGTDPNNLEMTTVSSLTYDIPFTLKNGTVYYWQIKAKDIDDNQITSPKWSFRTEDFLVQLPVQEIVWIWGYHRIKIKIDNAAIAWVRLELSYDDGETWETIPGANSLANVGYFVWRPTNFPLPFDQTNNVRTSDRCRIRAVPFDVNGQIVNSLMLIDNDALFKIKKKHPFAIFLNRNAY